MMMPIVSMNKMAMNESVAATCCYRQVATPTAVYWEVLNGGWIGSGYKSATTWNNDDNGTSFDNIKNSSYLSVKIDVASYVTVSDMLSVGYPGQNGDGDWVLEGVVIEKNSTTGLIDWAGSCSHTSETCVYRYTGTSYADNQHFESTVSHSEGGDNWQSAHDAVQFTS